MEEDQTGILQRGEESSSGQGASVLGKRQVPEQEGGDDDNLQLTLQENRPDSGDSHDGDNHMALVSLPAGTSAQEESSGGRVSKFVRLYGEGRRDQFRRGTYGEHTDGDNMLSGDLTTENPL